MAKKPQKIDSSRELLASEVPPSPDQIVGSTSYLARMLGKDRATIIRYRAAGMKEHDARPTKRGTDYTWNLATCWDWRYQSGVNDGRIAAAKESVDRGGTAPAPSGPGTWTHPSTGKVYTDDEVEAAAKAKVIEDSAKTRTARLRGDAEYQKFIGRLSDNEDITALWAYYTRMVIAGLASVAAANHRLFVEMGMHPDEARRRADAPIDEMIQFVEKTDPFSSPLDADDPVDEEEDDHETDGTDEDSATESGDDDAGTDTAYGDA